MRSGETSGNQFGVCLLFHYKLSVSFRSESSECNDSLQVQHSPGGLGLVNTLKRASGRTAMHQRPRGSGGRVAVPYSEGYRFDPVPPELKCPSSTLNLRPSCVISGDECVRCY